MANSSRENGNNNNKPAGTIHFLTQVAMWYLFSVLFNIELKTFFNLYNAPFVITFANLFVSCLASASTMGKETIIDMEWNKMIRKLSFVGLFQFVGTLSTNLSISAMAVSFTHIIKATEPIFTIGWIAYLAYNRTIAHSGNIITKAQLFSISIVVIGVIMSSVSETTYSRAGLMFGLLSNISFAARNVLLNSIMKEYRVGKEQLFLFSSVFGCVASLALAVLFEPHYLSLPKSAPVTHAVTNCCKRLVIVFASFAFFHVVPSHLSTAGSLITIFGVASYSLLRNMQSDHPSVSMRSFKKAIILFILGGIVLYLLTTSIATPANNNVTDNEDSETNLSGIGPGQLDEEEFTVDEQDDLGYPPGEDEDEEFDEKRPYGPRGNFNPFSNANVVSRIQERVVQDFGPTFAGKKYAIFMGAPNYNNGGDTAIYLGSVNFLKIIGVRIIHECTDQQRWICRYNVSRQFIRKDPSTTIVCLQGGGNMNDIYYMYEYQRITFISWFPNHSVALFPQSVKFWDKTKWNKSERAYSSSPDATLTARDERSFGLMKEHFPKQKVLLIPDMAFMIGHKQRPRMPEVDILCLMRKDGEKNKNVTVDYSVFPSHVTVATRSYWDPEHPEARRAYTPTEAAEIRTYAAMNIIAGAKVLISDRLHAHVMATLLDVPHVIVDNSYGKVTGNHNLWTKDCNGILVARSWPEAVEMGLRLLDQVNYYVYDNDMLETL